MEMQRAKIMCRLCFLSLILFLSTKRICVSLLSEAAECRRDVRAEMKATSLSTNRELCRSQHGEIG